MTNEIDTFAVDTKDLDELGTYVAEHIAVDLMDQGFTKIWLAEQAPSADDFTGKVKIVFAGSEWIKYQKRDTEKPCGYFITGISWSDDRKKRHAVNSVRYSHKIEKSIELPYFMALRVVKCYPRKIVFIVAK